MTSAIGNRRSDGFTLIELCMAVSVLGLMTALVWPALRDFSRRVTTQARVDELIQRLHAARQDAVLSGLPQEVRWAEEKTGPGRPVFFFPDGSAQFARFLIGEGSELAMTVFVQETGRIEIQHEK